MGVDCDGLAIGQFPVPSLQDSVLYFVHDRSGNFVLDGENVIHVSVTFLRPEVTATGRLNEAGSLDDTGKAGGPDHASS